MFADLRDPAIARHIALRVVMLRPRGNKESRRTALPALADPVVLARQFRCTSSRHFLQVHLRDMRSLTRTCKRSDLCVTPSEKLFEGLVNCRRREPRKRPRLDSNQRPTD